MSKLSVQRLGSLLGACALVVVPAREGEFQRASERATTRTETLLGALHGEPAGLRERLERLDPRPVPELLVLGLTARVPAAWTGEPLVLAPEERACVLEVLTATAFPLLRPHLAEVAASSADWQTRATAIDLLASASQPEAIGVLVALASAPDGAPAPGELRARYAAQLRRLLSSAPRGVDALRTLLPRIPPSLVRDTIDALAEQPPETVLELVSTALGRVSDLDALLLAYVARHALRAEPPFEPLVLQRVRAYLAHAEPALRALAAGACGVLGDDEAVPALIDLLESDDANLRHSARAALESITDLGFTERNDTWERWYREELEWWDSRYPTDLEAVRSGTQSDAMRALGAIATKHLHRDELALGLAETLVGINTERALTACGVLQQLGSLAAREGLELCAEQHPSTEVRERARQVLGVLETHARGSGPGRSR